MASNGSVQNQHRTHAATGWRGACRRGMVLGLVLCLHGLMLVALLQLNGWHSNAMLAAGSGEVALRLQLITARARPQTAQPPLPVQLPERTRQVAEAAPQAAPAQAPMRVQLPAHLSVLGAPAIASSSYRPYRDGGFGQALRQAQRGSRVRLPGSDEHRVEGITLTPVVSVRDVVHAIADASLCSAERLKMQRQALPPTDMDRLLEADGCGAHGGGTAVDAAVRQASSQALSGQ